MKGDAGVLSGCNHSQISYQTGVRPRITPQESSHLHKRRIQKRKVKQPDPPSRERFLFIPCLYRRCNRKRKGPAILLTGPRRHETWRNKGDRRLLPLYLCSGGYAIAPIGLSRPVLALVLAVLQTSQADDMPPPRACMKYRSNQGQARCRYPCGPAWHRRLRRCRYP